LRIIAHAETLRVPPLKAEGLARIHELSRNQASRFRAFRAAPFSARGAEQTPAPPASCHCLQRPARQLSEKENFHHRSIHRPRWTRYGGILE
jgi:hypothetical protein